MKKLLLAFLMLYAATAASAERVLKGLDEQDHLTVTLSDKPCDNESVKLFVALTGIPVDMAKMKNGKVVTDGSRPGYDADLCWLEDQKLGERLLGLKGYIFVIDDKGSMGGFKIKKGVDV